MQFWKFNTILMVYVITIDIGSRAWFGVFDGRLAWWSSILGIGLLFISLYCYCLLAHALSRDPPKVIFKVSFTEITEFQGLNWLPIKWLPPEEDFPFLGLDSRGQMRTCWVRKTTLWEADSHDLSYQVFPAYTIKGIPFNELIGWREYQP